MSRKKPRNWPGPPAALAGPVLDNHTHLPIGEWEIPKAGGVKLPLEEQLHRAYQVGVRGLITVGCEITDFDPTIELAHKFGDSAGFPRVRAAIALHPNEAPLHAGVLDVAADGWEHELKDHHVPLDEALAAVESRLDDPSIVAVGETGIDLFRTADAGLIAAKESFAAHLRMGFERSLPVQIHDRDAHQECLDVLYDTGADKGNAPIVFHCFSGGTHLARHVEKNGWYASFGGSLTFAANDDLREAFKSLSPDRILVETDAPYLTPVPYRGHPNASYVIAHTVRFIAQMWERSEEDALEQLQKNSEAVYGNVFCA